LGTSSALPLFVVGGCEKGTLKTHREERERELEIEIEIDK
jgi:hypothetical protein